jgi:hypothetical protein
MVCHVTKGEHPMTQAAKVDPQAFMEILGLDDEPLGIVYTDQKPAEGFAPKPMDLPTREKEVANAIDWPSIFANFSCVLGKIRLARKKKAVAYFSAEHFGCPGCGFWLGFMKPQTETIIHYVSTGIPDQLAGEHYCASPEILRGIQDSIDPPAAPHAYCVAQPLSLFAEDQQPDIVAFFARPESLCGLHQLATFVTNDPQVVSSPWGAACTNLITWPYKFLAEGQTKAVLGGWDPSARKFFDTDELTFCVPYSLYLQMLARYQTSFLMTKTWLTVRKKIDHSRRRHQKKPKQHP